MKVSETFELSAPAMIAAPTQWFNILHHLPEPLPEVRDPEDGKASRIETMQRIRLKMTEDHDNAAGPWVPIPKPVLTQYQAIGRPTPLYRARGLEKYLGTPARLYFKREDRLPTGSFKLNSAIAQAYYASQEGVTGLITETGAGQWGHALAYACSIYGLKSVVFWVKVSQEQKGYRSALAQMLGATIHPSPSTLTLSGQTVLANDPASPGSLGTAIGDAIEYAMAHPDYRYVSGSNLPHVLLHQTVIGLETKAQLAALDETPTRLIACAGGGSNLGGLMGPFLPEKYARGDDLRLIAAESDAAPRLTCGEYRYDHSDPAGLTPLTLSYTLGMDYMPPASHVGGLRQHSGSAVIGVLRRRQLLEAYAYSQVEALQAGRLMVETERILPAPESCHAVQAVIDAALEAKRSRRSEVIVSCLSGDGAFDLNGYKAILGV